VTGGRTYVDRFHVCNTLGPLGVSRLVHGGAPGADQLCHEWAAQNGVEHVEYRADWAQHGRAAGPIRNRKMLDNEQPHILIAFPGGRGTEDCIAAALERGIPVWRV